MIVYNKNKTGDSLV